MEKKGKAQARVGILALIALLFLLLILLTIVKNEAVNNYFVNRAMENKGIAVSMPSAIPDEDASNYQVTQEQLVGNYVFRLWERDSVIAYAEDEIPRAYLTLSLLGDPKVNVIEIWGAEVKILMQPGTDITGEGNPDLVIQTHSGGDCCFQYYVYDLGETAISTYALTQNSSCFGEFKDIDNDGVFEFFSCDGFFTYEHCSAAAAPKAPLVLMFVPGWGYLPATPNFKDLDLIRTRIVTDVAETEHGLSQGYHEKDRAAIVEHVLCPALQVALEYLYMGDPVTAESEFRRLYKYSDVSDIWWYLTDQVEKSRFYTLDALK